jgi:hypothetical protein
MTSLISAELGQMLALRKVRRGHVILIGDDRFLDQGHRFPGHLHHHLRELLAEGHLRLGEPRQDWDQRPVQVTTSGDQLHSRLENPQR